MGLEIVQAMQVIGGTLACSEIPYIPTPMLVVAGNRQKGGLAEICSCTAYFSVLHGGESTGNYTDYI